MQANVERLYVKLRQRESKKQSEPLSAYFKCSLLILQFALRFFTMYISYTEHVICNMLLTIIVL